MANQVSTTTRSARWCFTINLRDEDGDAIFAALPEGCRYVIWQHERGSGTEHDHLQGYIAFTSAKSMRQVKGLLGERAHVEVARGSEEENKKYCSKEDTRVRGPWSFGKEAEPGKRTDLAEIATRISGGEALGKIIGDRPDMYIKYSTGMSRLASLINPPRRDNLEVLCIWGESGVGKTWKAYEIDPNIYRVVYGNAGSWWDGYQDQDTVLFDEFRGQIPLTKMLQYLDKYGLRVEVKGATAPAKFTKVIITANSAPDCWYDDKELTRAAELQALLRRVGLGNTKNSQALTIRATSREQLEGELDAKLPSLPGMWACYRKLGPPGPAPAPAPQPQPIPQVIDEPGDDALVPAVIIPQPVKLHAVTVQGSAPKSLSAKHVIDLSKDEEEDFLGPAPSKKKETEVDKPEPSQPSSTGASMFMDIGPIPQPTQVSAADGISEDEEEEGGDE